MYEHLKYISPLMEDAVKNNRFAGARAAVIHKGETVYSESFGYADKENKVPMSKDTIFRLFSLTKPIIAAAAMILLERGIIELRYPLKWFIPSFENPMVLDENGLRPAQRDITLQDLLNMTSGICYPDGTPAGQKMGEVWGKQGWNYENGGKLLPTTEFISEMGKVPLAFTPGERWMYGASADVMGAVIEIISGMKLSEFLKKEIFDPLGMNDTGFYVPKEKYHRLAKVYEHTENSFGEYKGYNLCTTDFDEPPVFESGGAGLVSTMEDYEKFVKMLLGKGTYNGTRILGRKTVELMTQNNLTEAQEKSADWDSMKGQGYGNFMRVMTDRAEAGIIGSEGEFGWDGWLGCYFSADLTEDLAVLYFIQNTNSGCTDFTRKIQNIVRASID